MGRASSESASERVEPAAPRGQDPGVRRVVDQRMAEPPLPCVEGHDQRGVDQPVERGRSDRLTHEVDHIALLERHPDDGRDADHVARRLVQAVDASAQDRAQGQREPGRTGLGEGHPAVAQLERAVLDGGPHGLADEQRVALGPLMDQPCVVGIEGGPGDDRRELGRLRRSQAVELQPHDVRLVGPVRSVTRTHRGDDDQRASGGGRDDDLDHPRARDGRSSGRRRGRRRAVRRWSGSRSGRPWRRR